MSLSLGEKLRQAREEQGISISEVAEQTRISPHYLESIEKDNYKILPGGIFNKGFIKAFARYVGVNEAEALQDYVQAIGEADNAEAEGPKVYHPEVLTDDRTGPSLAPTVIFSVIILALMTGGILFLVRYLQNSGPVSNQAALTPPLANANANTNSTNGSNAVVSTTAVDKIVVELKAVSEPVWISYSVDGVAKVQTLAPDERLKLDASEAFKLSYSKAKLPNLEVSVNGRQVTMTAPQSKGAVDFEVTKANLTEIVQTGQNKSPESTSPPPPSPGATETSKRVVEPEKTKTPHPTPTSTAAPKPSPTVIVIGNRRPRTAPTNRPN